MSSIEMGAGVASTNATVSKKFKEAIFLIIIQNKNY
jgi:hypothetical protein